MRLNGKLTCWALASFKHWAQRAIAGKSNGALNIRSTTPSKNMVRRQECSGDANTQLANDLNLNTLGFLGQLMLRLYSIDKDQPGEGDNNCFWKMPSLFWKECHKFPKQKVFFMPRAIPAPKACALRSVQWLNYLKIKDGLQNQILFSSSFV